MPDVVGYVNINGHDNERNLWESVVKHDPFFAEGSVHSHGQSIGMIYSGSAAIAQAAAQLVDVQYVELPPILTLSRRQLRQTTSSRSGKCSSEQIPLLKR